MSDQKVYSGYKSIEALADVLREFSPRKVFCVTGKNSYSLCGAERHVGDVLKGYDHVRFSEYGAYPRIEDIERGVAIFRDERCDLVLGVGGGMALDIAKSISFLGDKAGSVEDYVIASKLSEARNIPLIAIPTTAGTGSESTHFTVVYVDKEKHSLAHRSMLPDCAILDPMLTRNLPRYQTASSGMDALCQAIESFWSVESTDESRAYSRKAMELIAPSIVRCVNEPDDEVRGRMLEGSNYSGRAINIAKTTAAHALSYPLTSYFNIPHGHAVALTLPRLMELNGDASASDIVDERGVEYVKDNFSELCGMLGVNTAGAACGVVDGILQGIGLKMRLSQYGVEDRNVEAIVNRALSSKRMANNPVRLSEGSLCRLLKAIL